MGLKVSFVTRPSSIRSPARSRARFGRSGFKHLESIGIEPAEIQKFGLQTLENYLHTILNIALCYPKYKNKSLHQRFLLDSAPQLWHSSFQARRSNWEFRRAIEARRARNGIRVRDFGEGVGCVIFFSLLS